MRWRGISTQPKRKGGTIWTAIKISHSEWICFDSLCASYYQGHSAILGGRQRAGSRCYSTAIIQSKDMFEPRSFVFFFYSSFNFIWRQQIDNFAMLPIYCRQKGSRQSQDVYECWVFFYFVRLIPLKWKFIHIWFMLRLREHFWTQFYGARALLLNAIFRTDNRHRILYYTYRR